jgi:hypothetical protein
MDIIRVASTEHSRSFAAGLRGMYLNMLVLGMRTD